MHTFDSLDILVQRCSELIGRSTQISMRGDEPVNNIIFVGNGEAEIACKAMVDLLAPIANIPVMHTSNGTLPLWIDLNTLVIVATSGAADGDAAQAIEDARANGTQLVVVSREDFHIDVDPNRESPYLHLPDPVSLGASLILELVYTLWSMMSSSALSRLVSINTSAQALHSLDFISQQRQAFGPEADAGSNPARLLTDVFRGKIPIFFAKTGIASVVASAWADRIRTTGSMSYAIPLTDPELSSDGWPYVRHSWPPSPACEGLILLDEDEEAAGSDLKLITRARNRLGSEVTVHELSLDGANPFERLVGAIHLAEWTSFYLAP